MSNLVPAQSFASPENRLDTQVIDGEIRVRSESIHWTLEVPEDRAYDGLVTIVPGYCGYEKSMSGLRGEFAQNGYATLTYNPARKPMSIIDSFHDAQGLHVSTQEAVAKEIRDFSIRRQIPNHRQLDLDKKILVPHSMGGLAAARFAARNSLSIDKLTNIATLGYSRFSLGALARHYHNIMNNSGQELTSAYQKQDLDLSHKDLLHIMRYCLRPQSIFEAISCFRESVLNDVAHIRAEGIPVAYIALGNDLVVRPNENIANHVDYYDVMEDAGHLAPATKPRRVAAHAIAAFQELDYKKTALSA